MIETIEELISRLLYEADWDEPESIYVGVIGDTRVDYEMTPELKQQVLEILREEKE